MKKNRKMIKFTALVFLCLLTISLARTESLNKTLSGLDLVTTGLTTTDRTYIHISPCTLYCAMLGAYNYSAIFLGVCFCGDDNLGQPLTYHEYSSDEMVNKTALFSGFGGTEYPTYRVCTRERNLNIEHNPYLRTNKKEDYKFIFKNIESDFQTNETEVHVDFGPASTEESILICTTCQAMFKVPGTFFISVSLKNKLSDAVEEQFWIAKNLLADVRANDEDIPKILEDGEPFNASLKIVSGSDLNISVTVDAYQKSYNNIDILEKIYKSYDPDGFEVIFFHGMSEGKVYTQDSLLFTENGQLVELELKASMNCEIRLQVIEVECIMGVPCETRVGHCCEPRLVNLQTREPLSENIHISSENTFNVKEDFTVSVKQGEQTINVNHLNIIVKKGQFIGLFYTLDCIEIGSPLPPKTVDKVVIVDSFLTPILNAYIPINMKTSIPYVVEIPLHSVLPKIPEITFELVVTSPLHQDPDNFTLTTIVPVQKRITTLSFVNGQFFEANKVCTFEVATDGDPVTFNYTIPGIVTNAVSTTNNSFNVFITMPGVYEVIVTAFNLINNKTESLEIYTDIPISDHSIILITRIHEIAQGHPFMVEVNLTGGLDVNVTLSVITTSEQIDLWQIPDASGGIQKQFEITINTCGDMLIESAAKEKYNSVADSKQNITVNVPCALGELDIVVSPSGMENGELEISIKDVFSLNIGLTSGSYPIYNISWGNGIYELKDQSDLFEPGRFTLSHQYSTGNYTVNVTVTTRFGGFKWFSVKLNVLLCIMPRVEFDYMSKPSPVQFTRGEDILLIAKWKHPMKYCEDNIEPKFLFESWRLQDSNNVTLASPNTMPNSKTNDGEYLKLIYSANKRSIPLGKYELTLLMDYDGEVSEFKAKFEIIRSLLIPLITNGVFQTIPFKKLMPDLNTTFYNFTIDATQSFDPDNKEAKTDGMTFTWECRVISPSNFVNLTVEARKIMNKTKYEADRCLSFNWTEASGTVSPYITYNTEMFQEGLDYEFKITVRKDVRESVYVQKINIAYGAPPNIIVKCLSCQEKINTMDRTIIEYTCNTCPYGLKLEAEWQVSADGESPWTDETKTTTGFNKPNLVISPNKLLPDKNYTFTLTIGYLGSIRKSVYIIQGLTSNTPFDGSCDVTPKKGSIMDKFSIICRDWNTFDGPIKYEFRYDRGDPVTSSISSASAPQYPVLNINQPNLPQFINKSLPQGRKDKDYIILIKIKILNKFQQYHDYPEIPVEVRPLNLSTFTPKSSNGQNDTSPSNVTSKSSKLQDALNSIGNVDPKDTEAVASAVMIKTAILESSKQEDEEAKKSITEKDSTYGFPVPKDEETLEEEKKKKEIRKKETESMLNMISEAPIENIGQLKSLGNAVAATTSDINDMSDNAQETATNFLEKSANAMNNMSLLPEESEQAMKPLFSGISNLLVYNTESNKDLEGDEKDSEEQKLKAENGDVSNNKAPDNTAKTKKAIENAEKLVNTLSTVLGVMSKNQVSGDKPVTGGTDAFSFNVQKSKPTEMSNKEVSEQFTLPSVDALFDSESLNEDINIENVNFKENIFIDGETSKNINSEVSSLILKTAQGSLKVQNTSEPFVITLSNKPENLVARNITMYMPGKTKYETIKLNSMSCSLILSINPINDIRNETILTVHVQYGKAPTESEYDIRVNISNLAPPIIEQASGFVFLNNSKSNYSTNVDEIPLEPLERKSYIRILEGNSFLLWNFTEFTHGYNNNSKLYLSFMYHGPMPDLVQLDNIYTFDVFDERGEFNYSMKSFCADCSYWNQNKSKWTNDGCELQPLNISMQKTVCHCNHLTSFGSLFVAPNPLPTPSLAMLKEGFVLLVTIVSILMLYIIGLLFARRADIADREKVAVVPLIDNEAGDTFLYEIIVNTGTRRHAGTKSNIFLNITGEKAQTGVRYLKSKEGQEFPRASSFVFVMSTEQPLGDLTYLRIWHDNSGGGWYLRDIEILDLQTEKKFVFLAGRWLAIDMGDGMVDYIFPVASDADLQDFNYLFTTHTKNKLSDAHIWYSIYARPPGSPFTRCQRLSVAISLLLSLMVANAMFYGAIPPGTPETENNINGFKFTWQQVFVAIVGALITVPVNLLLVTLFTSIKHEKHHEEPPNPTVGDEENPPESNESFDLISISTETEFVNRSDENKKESGRKGKSKEDTKKKKKKFYLPSWMLYPTWFLCVSVILGCAFLVVWYGMAFGNQKSLEWLGSVSIGLIQDVLLIQPIKVVLVGLFVALVLKKLEEQERGDIEQEVKSLGMNQNWFKKIVGNDGGKEDLFTRSNTDTLLPPDSNKLSKLRQLKLREKQMNLISKEIFLYLLFAGISAFLGYSLRDYQAYYQTKDIEEALKLKHEDNGKSFIEASSKALVWDYLEKVLITELYPDKWFELDKRWENDSFYDFPGFKYLNDMTSKIVTGARLRQLRVKEHSCSKVKAFKEVISIDCADHYSSSEEEDGDFDHKWNRRKDYGKRKMHPADMPWRFQQPSDLDGYPVEALIRKYSGGGYVTEIFPKWDNLAILKNLKQSRWLDRHTRALFVEFSVFNGGTGYFDSVALVFEFPPWGGIVHYHEVTTFKLYSANDAFALFVLLAQILFLFYTILFICREARMLYKERLSYFTQFWNLVEFSNIILSILVIIFFFWRSALARSLLGRLPYKAPNIYINLQFASMLDLFMTYTFALICFCITIKFIKLLRFNKRVSMLSSTLCRAWYPLMMFGVCYGIILIGCTIFTQMAFGRNLHGYRNTFSSFTSVMSLLLGKFSYYQFENTHKILGPMFFFGFNIFVNWIVMNMYISILNDILSEVYAELEDTQNEYEIVDFMMGKFREMVGVSKGNKRKAEVFEEALEEKDNYDSKSLSKASLRSSIQVVDPCEVDAWNQYYKKKYEENCQNISQSSDINVRLEDAEFFMNLNSQSNLGRLASANSLRTDISEEKLKHINSEDRYILENNIEDGYDEEYFSCLLVYSLGVLTVANRKIQYSDSESDTSEEMCDDGLEEFDEKISL